jgi:hypothetical protein
MFPVTAWYTRQPYCPTYRPVLSTLTAQTLEAAMWNVDTLICTLHSRKSVSILPRLSVRPDQNLKLHVRTIMSFRKIKKKKNKCKVI